MSGKPSCILRFRVSLTEIDPEIWRSIDVPENYSFWDLHVAIQDAMGWLDYHLHSFIPEKRSGLFKKPIGIPDGPLDNENVPGWEIPILDYFSRPGEVIGYEYDFGDGWHHKVELLSISKKEKQTSYPRCVEGERACPPEDCGGVPGYYHLLEALGNPGHEEHEEMNAWLKGHAKNYFPYHPEVFDPASVKFWNPKKRFKMAFEGK